MLSVSQSPGCSVLLPLTQQLSITKVLGLARQTLQYGGTNDESSFLGILKYNEKGTPRNTNYISFYLLNSS